jgi:hypothetical protein
MVRILGDHELIMEALCWEFIKRDGRLESTCDDARFLQSPSMQSLKEVSISEFV